MIPKMKAQGHEEKRISCKASQKHPGKNSSKIEEKKGFLSLTAFIEKTSYFLCIFYPLPKADKPKKEKTESH